MSIKRAKAIGDLHRKYLKENKPKMYRALQQSGELERHVREVGRRGDEMYHTIATQMAQSPDLPQDPQEWNQKLESIPHVAWEFIYEDVIYQPR